MKLKQKFNWIEWVLLAATTIFLFSSLNEDIGIKNSSTPSNWFCAWCDTNQQITTQESS